MDFLFTSAVVTLFMTSYYALTVICSDPFMHIEEWLKFLMNHKPDVGDIAKMWSNFMNLAVFTRLMRCR